MIDETDPVEFSAAARLSYFLLFAAQSAAAQFFSVYLKYLGLSAGDAGAVRALQTWAGVAAAPASAALSSSLFGSGRGRGAFAALLLLTSVAAYVSLVFVPPFAVPRDVTHCSHTATPGSGWGLFVLDNPNGTTKLETHESFSRILQETKDKTFNISVPEIKTADDPEIVQSPTTASTPEKVETLKGDSNRHKFISQKNRDMEDNESPEHKSADIDTKQTSDDKSSERKTSPDSWQMEERKGILSSYHKITNTPFIFKYDLPVAENSQRNSPPYIADSENDNKILVTPEHTDYEYVSQYLKPKPSVSHHYQWIDQSKFDAMQHGGVSGGQAEGGSKTFANPRLKMPQKIFLQNQPKHKQPLHTPRYREQELNGAGNDLDYSNTAKKQYSNQQQQQKEQILDLSQQYDSAKPLYQYHLPSQYTNENGIVKRDVRRVHNRISNSDVVHSVDLFHLEPVTSDHVLQSEITTRRGASGSVTDLSPLLQNNTALNSHLNVKSQIANISRPDANSAYMDSITYFSTLEGFGVNRYGSWSTVFYTVFAISLFLETGCQSALVWTLRLCGVMTRDTCAVLGELAASSQVLVGWSLVVCPLVAVVAALSPCPFQITAHMAIAAALTFCALLLLPLVAPVSRSRKRKPSKPSYRKTYEDMHATLLTRFSFSLRMGITGFITACNMEFMMWYMEAQETFSHNYEYLYCGYSATASITQFLLNRVLRKRTEAGEDAESESDDETGGGRWQLLRTEVTGHQRWWWLWEAGTLLLGVEQLAAQLQPVWVLPPLLGTLQGAGSALSSGGTVGSARMSYGIGYGCGCMVAGFIVQKWGAAVLFQVLSLGTSACAAVAAIIRGLARCTANQRQQARQHSFSIASTESDASSDGEENEIAETDDWLVQALQRDEYQQAKKSHRTEC
ncbi:uncharacterized protein LOC126335095 [Schistocerca gregaria]|uniref:uncharacterized protein LOC126335095 n=1 Tax=Schistocerca gregaria TaxID=7010 RepID=UPI00211DBCDE|nr:uncharacterized protein LOC126335095 [Schistocerca gregaria]